MKYSLIIPHFDDTFRLQRLLHTVPVQRKDLEVIVVDDCSNEQTKLARLQERWPMIIWLSTTINSGAGAARNVGLQRAQGQFLVFADSDDEFVSGAFAVFDKYADANVDLIYFLAEGRQEIDGSPSNRADRINNLCHAYLEKASADRLEQLKVRHVVPWAKLYSRAFITLLGLTFEEIRVSNDVAFNVLAATQSRHIHVAPEVVYRVFRRRGSLTADTKASTFLARVQTLARLASKLKQLGIHERPVASGLMLRSLAYGLVTAFQVWRICLTSNMALKLHQGFQITSWKRFLKNYWIEHRENAAARKEFLH